MLAREIMTTDVVTARPDTDIGEIARLMVERRISALPIVVDDGHIVGIVTESDLLHRQENDTERKRKWWVELVSDAEARSREYLKSHGHKAQDLMSRVVVTIPDDAPLAHVAQLLDSHRIRRVPVLRDGRLVGIISRADLVRALATVLAKPGPSPVDDATLHKTIYDALRKERWINTLYVTFTVDNGAVELRGFADSATQRDALRVLVEGVPGVRSVTNKVVAYRPQYVT
jgi:CBS domain-containing protein